MPTVLRVGPCRFHFHSREHDPPHVHVSSPEGEAAFELGPVGRRGSSGYTRQELTRIEEIVVTHEKEFLRRWHEYFAR